MVPLGLVKIKMEMQSWRLCPRTWRAFQSCVLNESGKHSGLGSRFPETIRSPCHWLPVTFGSSLAFSVGEVVQGGQEMVVSTCFFPALGLNRNTMRTVFRSLFLTYGALGVWFLSPVSLGLAKKQVWLWLKRAPEHPEHDAVALEAGMKVRGGPSMCSKVSEGGISGVCFFIPQEFGALRWQPEGHTLQSQNQAEDFGRDKNRRNQIYSLTCKPGCQGQGQPCDRQPICPFTFLAVA